MPTLFSTPKQPEVKIPEPEPVAPMPDPQAQATEKRKKLAKQLQSGRASTMLSSDYDRASDKLGG